MTNYNADNERISWEFTVQGQPLRAVYDYCRELCEGRSEVAPFPHHLVFAIASRLYGRSVSQE